MAPPKSPWSKIAAAKSTPQNDLASRAKPSAKEAKPGNAVPTAMAADTYSAAQTDEIEALKAIYMDDFEEVEAKGAWSKTTDRVLRLRLKSFSDHHTFIVLSIKLTATYPKTVPSLQIENTAQLRQKTQQTLKKLIVDRPKELLGEVMIYDIASSIQEILEDEVTARQNEGPLPSLEEERAGHEAAAAELAKQHEEELQKKRDEEKAEEERALQQMVSDEMRRKELLIKRKSRGPPQTPVSLRFAEDGSTNHVSFDRMIMVQDGDDNIEFTTVEGFLPYKTGPVTEGLLVKPSDVNSGITMVLKRTTVPGPKASSRVQLKKAVLEFEEEMEDLKRLRQPNVLSVFEFKIQQTIDSGWEINILIELANRGSLADKLDDDGQIAVAKVRAWTIELLEAADFYHRNGVIHKRIHPHNILLFKPPNGSVSVKLADAGFQETLYTLQDHSRESQPYTTPRSAFWVASELAHESRRTRKTDVWDLGVVFVQMLFGLDAPEKYSSPQNLVDTLECSEPLQEIIGKLFKPDPKKRPSAFDLIPCEFLREDVPIYDQPSSPLHGRLSFSSLGHHRQRRESSTGIGSVLSRYASEWVEAGRLGKGGYGEVVKARNKVDGRIYAIKKIKQKSASALTEVLSEVMLLSRLNHPYVVRYYTAWPEEEWGAFETEDESSTIFTEDGDSDVSPGDTGTDMDMGRSTGGLDFISSSGYPKVEFGEESEDEDDGVVFGEDTDEDIDETDSTGQRSPLVKRRTVSDSRPTRPPVKTILYIQMEFCEKQTLRDLIRRDLHDDPEEYWRLFRQMLEGLAHIHSHGIIHRDLKPDNIFIDVAKVPKIGDFGLATSGQYQRTDREVTNSSTQDGDMTRSVGTALYVAPELRSTVGGNYNDKVDMYSMGIIFFEMCYPLKTAMERDHVVRKLRERRHDLPPEFETPEKSLQGSIIMSLISHRPSERPSCAELLRSGKVPLQIEDEAVKEALQALSDRNSPHYSKMMAALFSQKPDNQVKDYAWDMAIGVNAPGVKANDVLLQNLVKDRLAVIFRGHGAVEVQRQALLPWSPHYANNNVVKLFDPSGTLVQLPYDLTLPYARSIGRGSALLEKTYTIGTVFRDAYTGGAPRSNGEADFDVISYDTLDLALKEAEVLKVIDEVIDEFPSLGSVSMCFHLNHSDLLEMVLDFCRINVPQRPAVKEVLSKLNIQQNTWQKIRNELRAPEVGVSSTSLEDLSRFDWRDTPEKAFSKLRRIFEGSRYLDRTHAVFAHLSSVVTYMKHWGVKRKVYINPLSSFNEKFYSGGVLFQCLFDSKKREVLAAGGRYDHLIDEYRPKVQGQSQPTVGYHAVGMNLGWDRLVNSMSRHLRKPTKSAFLKKQHTEEDILNVSWIPRRCDCLVASFDSTVLRSTGVKMVADLISHGYTAELSIDAHSIEDLLRHYRDDRHSWIIVIKHSVTSDKPDLKVKSMAKKEDTDIRSADLLNYLRNELRDRELREGSAGTRQVGLRNGHAPSLSAQPATSKANVDVLIAAHRSKKSNKWSIVEAALSRSAELLSSFQNAPIAAIETKEEVMNLIRETRLSDPDSWRRCIQSLPVAERKYLQELHDLLLSYAARWKEVSDGEYGRSGEGGKAFVYNFRTGGCLLYDLEN